MGLLTQIRDGEGTEQTAGVTESAAVKTVQVPLRSKDISTELLTARKLYRGFLRNAADSNALNVDGSVVKQDFFVAATTGLTRYIRQARFILNGNNFEMDTQDARRFGTATAGNSPLTNGLSFYAVQGGIRTDIFAEPVRRSIDFMTYMDSFVNLKNTITATSDFLSLDFIFEEPVVLVPSSNDKLILEVADDLTTITLFNVLLRGWQERV